MSKNLLLKKSSKGGNFILWFTKSSVPLKTFNFYLLNAFWESPICFDFIIKKYYWFSKYIILLKERQLFYKKKYTSLKSIKYL